MIIYYFLFIVAILLILLIFIINNNVKKILEEEEEIFFNENTLKKNEKNYLNMNNKNYLYENKNNNNNLMNNLKSCQVPSLNTEQCYKSRYFECPIVNGNYLQCTNNYIPKPKEYNSDCGNRTFEMVPYPWKISENCYYDKINFDRNIFKKDII